MATSKKEAKTEKVAAAKSNSTKEKSSLSSKASQERGGAEASKMKIRDSKSAANGDRHDQ